MPPKLGEVWVKEWDTVVFGRLGAQWTLRKFSTVHNHGQGPTGDRMVEEWECTAEAPSSGLGSGGGDDSGKGASSGGQPGIGGGCGACSGGELGISGASSGGDLSRNRSRSRSLRRSG